MFSGELKQSKLLSGWQILSAEQSHDEHAVTKGNRTGLSAYARIVRDDDLASIAGKPSSLGDSHVAFVRSRVLSWTMGPSRATPS